MNLQQIAQQVKDLIVQGELDEGATLLVNFFNQEYLSQADKAQFQLYNQALHQLSQLNELKHQVLTGVISSEDADLKRNKIRAGLLEIAEELKTFDGQKAVPIQPISPSITTDFTIAKKRRIMLILIVGVPMTIMLLMLAFGIQTCDRVVDNVVPEFNKEQQEPSAKGQPVDGTEQGKLEEQKPEETFTGCYIETGTMTELLQQAEMMGAAIMELPEHKKYQVLDTKERNFAGKTVYFFKIQEGEYTGWVRGIQLAFTSPECLN